MVKFQFSSVQSLIRDRLFATPWVTAHQASLSITNSRSSLQIQVHWVSDAIQPSHPRSPPFPPTPNPSQHQNLFQWVNSLHEVAGWHHRLNGYEFAWTPGVGDGQGGLVCCNSWGHKDSDTTEQLNWTDGGLEHRFYNEIDLGSNSSCRIFWVSV